jgi:hypothetical protein
MIDKTMCEVLWRNISDFYVSLRVEVGKHPQVILDFVGFWRLAAVYQGSQITTDKLTKIVSYIVLKRLKNDVKRDSKDLILKFIR